MTERDRHDCQRMVRQWGIQSVGETVPISVVGTGPNLTKATDVGLHRAARLLALASEHYGS